MDHSGQPVVVRANGIAHSFGEVQALHSLDFAVTAGEVVSVLGPNGAGKTTLIKVLLGLLPPDAGTVKLFGHAPTNRAARVRVGTMLQVGEVPQYLRIREHIDLFRSYYPRPMPLSEVIAAAGLEDIADRLSKDLSGGQRQRLMFALAICGDPDLLFLDEPTVGLDVGARRAFWKTIRSFVDRGRSVLLTTHYLEEADALADRIVVIDQGRSVTEGSPDSIKARFTQRRIQCRPSISIEQLRTLPGVLSVESEGGHSVTLITMQTESTLRALLSQDSEVSDITVAGIGLEEAFLHLTQPAAQERAA